LASAAVRRHDSQASVIAGQTIIAVPSYRAFAGAAGMVRRHVARALFGTPEKRRQQFLSACSRSVRRSRPDTSADIGTEARLDVYGECRRCWCDDISVVQSHATCGVSSTRSFFGCRDQRGARRCWSWDPRSIDDVAALAPPCHIPIPIKAAHAVPRSGTDSKGAWPVVR